MSSSHLFLYLIASAVLVWITIYTLSKSRRAKQWLIASSVLGIGWGPLFVSLAHSESIHAFTLLPSGWDMIEVAILSGLFWGITSTIVLSRKSGAIKSPVKVNIKRVLISYAIVILAIVIAGIFNTSINIAAVLALGMLSLILALNHRTLLITAVATAIAVAGLATIIAIGTPLLLPEQEVQSFNRIANQNSLLAIPDIALISVVALAAVVLPHWWLDQNLASSTSQ